MTIVKTLKALYERLGGTPSDVANATRAIDVLNAIAALYGGASNATHIAKAIANIAAVASGLIKPTGTKTITSNGSGIDVTEYAAVDVAVPQPSGTISITANGTGIDVANYATADVNVPNDNTDLINLIEGDITSITIPQGTTRIKRSAFAYCANLTEIIIPNSVVSRGIGIEAFAYTNIRSITFPAGIVMIDDSVCAGCVYLTDVLIPNTVDTIGKNAFQDCGSLQSIVIPNSVRDIQENAFLDCNLLSDIYYTGTQLQWEAITGLSGAGIPQGCTVHYEYTPS